MNRTHLDFETRSRVNLQEVGAWKYAQDPSTQIMAMAYGPSRDKIVSFNGLKMGFDWSVAKFPDAASWADAVIVAQNAPFEYAVFNLILHRRFGWPARWDPALWDCTMARAAQVGLPLDLDTMSRALKLKTPKDLEGKRIMLQLCQPRADGTFDEDPAKYERMCQYNVTDVIAELEADEQLPALVPHERPIWEADLVANRRGVAVDLELSAKAEQFAARTIKTLNARLLRLTGGGVTKYSQVAEIKRWVAAQGLPEFRGEDAASLDKVGLLKLMMRDDVSPRLKEVIHIRQQAAKSSTAKYRKTLDTAGNDERVRGVLQYHAAHTGRWGGRLIQPQNYPHGFKPEEQAVAIDLVLREDYDGFLARYGERTMGALSDVLRGTIIAGPGKVLVAADLNAIEPCVLMTLAGAKEVVADLRAGKKPYMPLAQDIYQDPTLTKERDPEKYDIGKRTFLGSGYGMGWKKLQQNIFEETAKLGKPLWVEDELAERATTTYREKYPEIPRLWASVDAAAQAAVKNPGVNYECCGGRVIWGMTRDRRFLVARLPSGRYLWYYKPEIRLVPTPWGEKREAMCYWGLDPKTKVWGLIKTYGGLLVENLTQAIARDILAHGMLETEKIPGTHAVMTVHDEDVGEADDPGPERHPEVLERFIGAMCKNLPEWAREYPVNAEGWVGYRYHK